MSLTEAVFVFEESSAIAIGTAIQIDKYGHHIDSDPDSDGDPERAVYRHRRLASMTLG